SARGGVHDPAAMETVVDHERMGLLLSVHARLLLPRLGARADRESPAVSLIFVVCEWPVASPFGNRARRGRGARGAPTRRGCRSAPGASPDEGAARHRASPHVRAVSRTTRPRALSRPACP